jgi:hypothetical protein
MRRGCSWDPNTNTCIWDSTRVDRYRNDQNIAFSGFEGKWVSFPNGASYSKTSSWETCEEKTTTDSFTLGLSQSLTVGYTASSLGGGTTFESTFESNQEWVEEVSQSASNCLGEEIEEACNTPCLNDDQQNYDVWQYRTIGTSDTGDFYEIGSCNLVCVSTNNNRIDTKPKGPPWACNNERGCACVRHDDWAIEEDRESVVVCCKENDPESPIYDESLPWNVEAKRKTRSSCK